MAFSEEHLSRYGESVANRLGEVRARIERAGGDLSLVKIVAVTKTFGLDAVIAAGRAGIRDIGENYAAELVMKAGALRDLSLDGEIRWHFLGELQRNKINRIQPYVDLYEGIDRYEEGEALALRSPGAKVLIEVDTAGTKGRAGVPPSGVSVLLDRLRHLDLRIEGLMTVAPPGGGEAAGRAFRSVTNLRTELGLREASMGMSDDLEFAVVEGSTMVRVGRALFGPRP